MHTMVGQTVQISVKLLCCFCVTLKMDYVNRVKDDLRSYASNHGNPEEIFTVIADCKVRELRDSMDHPRQPVVLHFSDGTMTLDEIGADEEEEEAPGPVVDPKTLTWAPWVWYQALTAGSEVIRVCDFLGGHLADFFGITTPKYQLEIDERLSMLEEEKEERLQIKANTEAWSGKLEATSFKLVPTDSKLEATSFKLVPTSTKLEEGYEMIPLEAGDLPRVFPDVVEVISEQPTSGRGDAPSTTSVSDVRID